MSGTIDIALTSFLSSWVPIIQPFTLSLFFASVFLCSPCTLEFVQQQDHLFCLFLVLKPRTQICPCFGQAGPMVPSLYETAYRFHKDYNFFQTRFLSRIFQCNPLDAFQEEMKMYFLEFFSCY